MVACVADRHPVQAQRLDGGWDIEEGVTEEIRGFETASWRSEQWTGLIVTTVQQNGQQQTVIDVVDVEQRRHADTLSCIPA